MPERADTIAPPLFIVQDTAPDATIRLLRAAAERRGIDSWVLAARQTRAWQSDVIPAGSLLYPASSSAPALLVYEALWRPDLGTFGNDLHPCGPLRVTLNQPRALAVAGLPVPRALPVAGTDPGLLQAAVDYLGGFPIVLRYAGHSTGLGIVRVDSLAGLCSLLEHSHGTGRFPELVEYVHDAQHWRVAVVGGRVAGWCRGVNPASDFRSVASDNPDDFTVPLPDGIGELATRVCSVLDLGAAGVDVLQVPTGELFALEANFPFYFGHLDEHGHDVAGAIVDELLRISAACRP